MARRERIVPLSPRQLLPIHLASQLDSTTVRTMLREGSWIKARSGAYVSRMDLDDAAQRLAAERYARPTTFDHERARALAGMSAVVARARVRGVPEMLVHHSAALVHGLDVWSMPAKTHVGRRDFPGRGTAPDLAVHTAAVHEDEIVTDIGVFYVDLAWPELRLVVEYDGQVKYDDLAGGDPARVVAAEKDREDAIRAQGWTFVRMTARQLSTPDLFEGRLRRALAGRRTGPMAPRPEFLLRR